MFFSMRKNPLVREVILHAYEYFHGGEAVRSRMQRLMRQAVQEFVVAEIRQTGPFGWKIDPTLFTMPAVLDAFPSAKVVHLIRDGRDVMLSRLNARLEHLEDPVNRVMTFGAADVDTFEGQPLNEATVRKLRNELEMTHWVTAVEYGLHGRQYGDRYFEIKYERICAEPIHAFEEIFDFLGVPFLNAAKDWSKSAVAKNRVGKWKDLTPETMARPLEIGEPLLRKLGYI
ncbi:MAG: sulfotransferase family protein [Acidobacteriota bacterium]